MSDLRDFNINYDDNKKENQLYQRNINEKLNIIELILSDPTTIKESEVESSLLKSMDLKISPKGQSKISAWFVKSKIGEKGYIQSIYLSKRRGKKETAFETFTLTPEIFMALIEFVKTSQEINFLNKNKPSFVFSSKDNSDEELIKKLSSIDIDLLSKINIEDLKSINIEALKNFSISNELKSFRIKVLSHIENNDLETEIEKTLKEHQSLLPLIIPSIDSIKKFQYNIDIEGYDLNIGDINTISTDGIPNLVELKRTDMKLLNKRKYRNNTYAPSKELSSAIQQANIQRSLYTINANNIDDTLVKSVILCGNADIEFKDENHDIYLNNFNIIKYNNKDLEIITYDDLIKRVDKLIELFKVK